MKLMLSRMETSLKSNKMFRIKMKRMMELFLPKLYTSFV